MGDGIIVGCLAPSIQMPKDHPPAMRGGSQSILNATIVPVNESDSQNTSDT